ncbi:MAG: hypothetical protein MZV64_73490 [Ignavibacteriales bacterium]|nr:hypothetical protein [Ignavibacteriales bacterium]
MPPDRPTMTRSPSSIRRCSVIAPGDLARDPRLEACVEYGMPQRAACSEQPFDGRSAR